ncbi:NAD(P)/FAD-dependent oxidoreductase [Rhodococcus sp. IEGM 1379]|uniref:NAD(P)/FAD-dependent oxidoreductase n=1 Tax=Rhodococcus sp. IEGM 1379 TaxID=3047086 RepID=UPI0024B64616|nr:NAD(P)/FAD-dependent oxidoreductase [Rhodococcus sp. IEGM 1379]MDI9917949.1 NAD(P)/FAD-dependent oxidoreductase [Rhodococcus sp. IEGM 1379]
MTKNTYDVAVIGGGAAGLNAALILGQARRSVVVFDNGAPRNAAADHMNGFLSRDGMNPAELVTIGRGEVRKFGGEFHDGTVVAVVRTDDGFVIELADDSTMSVRKVLVATGLTDRLPTELEGFGERWGRDVLHCPYCHGYDVRDQPLGIIAKNVDMAMHQAVMVRQWSDDVVLFLHRIAELGAEDREKLAALDISIVDGLVAAPVVDDDRLVGLKLADGTTVARSAVFVGGAITMDPNDSILRSFGAATATTMMGEFVTADAMGATSVAGVWAAGNVVDPGAQVIMAAAAGAKAGAGINMALTADDLETALALRRSISA